MSEFITAIDAGKHKTKALGNAIGDEVKRVNFRTKLYDTANGDVELEGNSYIVGFEGKEYIIGDQGEEGDNSISKTTLVHKLSAYTAVSKIIKDTSVDPGTENVVNMVLGCPSNIFKSKVLKEEYREYVKGEGQIELSVNKEKYSFKIDRVVIRCEGSGIIYMKPELFKNKKTAVIDLGGRNMNFAVYENMTSVPSTVFANNLGSTSLKTELKEQLQIYTGEAVDMSDAAYALKEGGLNIKGNLDEKTAVIVQQCKRNYIRKIIQDIKEKGINLNTMSVVSIGGTSITVESELKEAIDHIDVIKDRPQTISVEGFYKVAAVKFQ